MKTIRRFCPALLSSSLCSTLALFAITDITGRGCTIFVLTDTNSALFCNNEDSTSFKTRIWFIPSSGKHHGGVYVGFNHDYAQGGMNTEGLAYDWVAGYNEKWTPDPKLPIVLGNSGQEALESCSTVEEAITYFRGHQDRGFGRAKILLADRTGASIIIGGKDGKLDVQPSSTCRGFGYGEPTLNKMLRPDSEPTVANGFKILSDCRQTGQYGTKYSNIYDLKSGDIFLFPLPVRHDEVTLNLNAELKKGPHYYDMPQIKEELEQPARPLLEDMERLLLDKYEPIPDNEPEVTARVRALLQSYRDRTVYAGDFTENFSFGPLWNTEGSGLKQVQEEAQEEAKALGPLVSLSLVDRSEDGGKRSYRYRLEFEQHTLLQHLVFDEKGKLAMSRTEDIR